MLSSDDHSVNKKKYLSLNVYARGSHDRILSFYYDLGVREFSDDIII